MDLRNFLSCFSVALIGVAMWAHLPNFVFSRDMVRKTALGLTMGLSAVASMLVPMQIEAGIIFDLRSPLLAAAGIVGGPVAASLAALLALLFRAHLGGVGMWAGMTGIVVSAALGAASNAVVGRRGFRPLDLALVSGLVTVGGLLTPLLLPSSMWRAAFPVVGEVAGVNFLFTWLVVLSLLRDEQLRLLIQSDGIHRAIISTLPDSLNAKDAHGRFLTANPATARLMQVASPVDLVGRSDADFYPAETAQGFRAEELSVLEGQTVGPIDQEVRFADGSIRWLTSLKTPLRDRTGMVSGIITHNRDVTEEKRLASELTKMEGFLREAMANMAEGLVLFDSDGVIRFCNQQYRDLFPRTRDLRVAGARLADILQAAVQCGEESPKADEATWISDCLDNLREPRDRSFELDDGRIIEARSRPVSGSDTLVVYADVTARRRIEQDLLRRATHDPLTGLANRAEFEFRLRAAHERAMVGDASFAVLMMDLDRFKRVNDTFGHAVGDALLIDVAGRLRASVRDGDLVARLGGDEFAFLIFGRDLACGAGSLADRALRSLREPFNAKGTVLTPGGSIGIAVFVPVADPTTLVAMADQALYAAKRVGGNQFRFADGNAAPETQAA